MLIVHHLQVSQSERIIWLCEELGLSYDLRLHQRDPVFSPQSIKDLHPIGAAPIIQDGALTLAETAACMEYIIHKYGQGRLVRSPANEDYATYLYWFHFSNGTLQPGMSLLTVLQSANLGNDSAVTTRATARVNRYLEHLDNHLASNTWLDSDHFTAADITTIFSLTTMRTFCTVDLSPYTNVLAYIQRATKRPAYRSARGKGDPDLPDMLDGRPPVRFTGLHLGS